MMETLGDFLVFVLLFVCTVFLAWAFKFLIWGPDESGEIPSYELLAAKGLIVSEKLVKSNPVVGVSKIGDADDAVYHVERYSSYGTFFVDYPARSSSLDVRADDGSGLRVDRVKVLYRNRFLVKRADYDRLYIGS